MSEWSTQTQSGAARDLPGSAGPKGGRLAGQTPRAREIRARIKALQDKLEMACEAPGPRVVLPRVRDGETGRIDARKVADFMGVALGPLLGGLGLDPAVVQVDPSAAAWQRALRPLERSLVLLHKCFGPAEAIREWLNTPRLDLEGSTALEKILQGRAEEVALILELAWNGDSY